MFDTDVLVQLMIVIFCVVGIPIVGLGFGQLIVWVTHKWDKRQ